MADLMEIGSTCERVGCWATFVVTIGRGRPRRYCSDECRRDAYNDRRRCEARIERLEALLRRERHLLAAMGEAEPAAEPDESACLRPPGACSHHATGHCGDVVTPPGQAADR